MLLIGVADVKHAPGIALDLNWFARRAKHLVAAEISAVKFGDAANVVSCFRVSRNSRTPGHRAGTGVVRSQAQPNIAAVALEQLLQMPDAGIHVLLGIKRV